ncbi:protocadherin-16-like [Lethenteron reissneri]|uniref:protocadherin-16-like n=1 Tax=Lethenteron reissneri TaxID=7753 RepID=UPI002AB657F2|nr:protocadherin-16-like [Lethenteron reissneri]
MIMIVPPGFSILSDPANWLHVDSVSGEVRTAAKLDRESSFVQDGRYYTASFLATDDGNPPATGTSTLVITLADVNDNAPTVTPLQGRVCEGVRGVAVALLRASDRDAGANGGPFSFVLRGASAAAWKLEGANGTHAQLVLTRPLPLGLHRVQLRVTDSGVPPQNADVAFQASCVQLPRRAQSPTAAPRGPPSSSCSRPPEAAGSSPPSSSPRRPRCSPSSRGGEARESLAPPVHVVPPDFPNPLPPPPNRHHPPTTTAVNTPRTRHAPCRQAARAWRARGDAQRASPRTRPGHVSPLTHRHNTQPKTKTKIPRMALNRLLGQVLLASTRTPHGSPHATTTAAAAANKSSRVPPKWC